MILAWSLQIRARHLLQTSFVAVVCFVVFVVYRYFKRLRIPRIGHAAGWFSSAHAKRDFIQRGFQLVDEGYQKVRLSKSLLMQNAKDLH